MEGPSHAHGIMDDTEEHEKIQALRKRKAIAIYDSDYDLSSDDSYQCPQGLDGDSSDDSGCGVNKKVNKGKKKKISHSNVMQEVKEVKKRGRRPSLSFSRKRRKGKEKMNLEEKDKQEQTCVPSLKKGMGRTLALGPFSVIGHWYIASGFVKDLTALFKAFDEEESWRFSAFARRWQKFRFSLIYRGRYSFKELLEFTEEICFWTKKFLAPHHNMKWRVGALYTLYGLYHKHPLKHFYKIRLEADEYEYLEGFATSFQCSAENPDPAYVFYKLKIDGIFYYVATSDEMGLSLYSVERRRDIMNYEIQWVPHEYAASSVFPEHERELHKSLMQEYEKVKSKIWGEETDKALSYVQSNIMAEVDAVLAGLQNTPQERTTNVSQASAEVSDIGKRRGAVRDKAAALSTTDDFLVRKQLRSPQKNSKEQSATPGRATGSVGGNESIQEDSCQVMKLKEIMGFMDSPTEGTHNPLKPVKINRNKTLQNHLHKEIQDSGTAGSCRTEDLEGVILPNESFRQTYQEEQPSASGGIQMELDILNENINSYQQSIQRCRPRKSPSPKNIVLCKGTYPEGKIEKFISVTGESPQEQLNSVSNKKTNSYHQSMHRSRPRKSLSPQNIVLSKVTFTEDNIERISSSNESGHGDRPGTSSSQQKIVFCKETSPDIIYKTSFPQQREKLKTPSLVHKSKQTAKGKGILNADCITENVLKEKVSVICVSRNTEAKEMLPTKVVMMIEEDVLESETSTAEQSTKNTLSGSYSLPQRSKWADRLSKPIKAISDINDETICSSGTNQENSSAAMDENLSQSFSEDQGITVESVCAQAYHEQAITNTENINEVVGCDQVTSPENVCEKVSNNQSITGSPLSDQPKSEAISHTANNNQTTSHTVSQESFGSMNPVGKVITVEILAGMHQNKHLQSVLKAQSMVFLKLNFQVENVTVHSAKFKMHEKYLETIQDNKQKLEGFKNKFRSLLPPAYKNYKMLLKLAVDKSVLDKKGIATKHSKQDSWSLREQNPEPLPALPQIGENTKTKSEEEPFTFYTQKESKPGYSSNKINANGVNTVSSKTVTHLVSNRESLTSRAEKEQTSKRLSVNDESTGPSKTLMPLISQKTSNMKKMSITSLISEPEDQGQDSTTNTAAQTTHVIQVGKSSASLSSARSTAPFSPPARTTTESRVRVLVSEGNHHSKPCSPLTSTSSCISNIQDKLCKPLQIYKVVTTNINKTVLPPYSLSSQGTENTACASVEELKTLQTGSQIMLNKINANPRERPAGNCVGVSESTPSTITQVEVHETTTGLQDNEVYDSFSPAKSFDDSRPHSSVLEDNCLDVTSPDIIYKTSFPQEREKLKTPSLVHKNKQTAKGKGILNVDCITEDLMKGVSVICVSRNTEAKEMLPTKVVKMIEEDVLESKTSTAEEQSTKNTLSVSCSLPQMSIWADRLSKPINAISDITDETICSSGTNQKNSSAAMDENSSQSFSEDQGITISNVCAQAHHEQAITDTENVNEVVGCDQVISPENVCEKVSNDQSITGSPLSDQPKSAAISHTANNNQTTSHTVSQESFGSMNPVGKVITVEILAGKHQNKHLQSVLKAQSMVFLKLNFQVENVIVHSAKFKMHEKYLETIQDNKQKLEGFKNKFRSLLPPEYKNYKMLLKLAVDKSVIDKKGIATKHSKQDSWSLREKHPKQNPEALPVLPQIGENTSAKSEEEPFMFSSKKESELGYPSNKINANGANTVSSKTVTHLISNRGSLTSCAQIEKSSKWLSVSDESTGPSKILMPLISQKASNMKKSIASLSEPEDQGQDSTTNTAAQTTHVIQVGKPSASLSSARNTASFSPPARTTTESHVCFLVSEGNQHSKPCSPLTSTTSHISNTEDKPCKPLQVHKEVTTNINKNVIPPYSVSNQGTETTACASVEEYKPLQTGSQILPNKMKANPREKPAADAVGVCECTPSTMTQVEVHETTTGLQGNEVYDNFSPAKSFDDARPHSSLLEDSCLDEHYDFTVKVLENSPHGEKLKGGSDLSQDYASVKEYIQQIHTDTCTETKSNSVINDKNLILFTNSSHQRCQIIEEVEGRPRKTTGEMSLSMNSGASSASTLAVNPSFRNSNLHAKDKDVNVISLSPSPTTTLSGNMLHSTKTDMSASNVSSNSICSFYFFSKSKKGSLLTKPSSKTRPSSNSSVNKPSIPFLFMEKLFSKKQ